MNRALGPFRVESAGTSRGYKVVRVFNHRLFPQGERVYEHRLIMVNKLKRPLKVWEVVHHKDGNKKNNDPANLEVLKDQGKHASLHLKKWHQTASRLEKAKRSTAISAAKKGKPQPWAKGPKGVVRTEQFKQDVSLSMKRYCSKLPPGEMARRASLRKNFRGGNSR